MMLIIGKQLVENLPFFRASQYFGAEVSTCATRKENVQFRYHTADNQ